MKKTILLFIMALLSVACFAAITPTANNIVADKYVRISLVNQEPDPTEPGKIVTVRFKIANYGKYDTGYITAGIKSEFPFTIVSESSEKDIGILERRQYAEKSQIVEWKLLVDKDAPEGSHNITVYYNEAGAGGTISFEDDFPINVKTSDAVIQVKKITLTPVDIEPGKDAKVSIVLKNIADSAVKDIKVSLNLDAIAISTLDSTAQQIIQKLNGKEEKELVFRIIADTDADIGVYKIPLKIEFKDTLNNAYNQNSTFGIPLNSHVKYLLNIEGSAIKYLNQHGEVTIRMSNKGVNGIKFLTAELKPSPQYEILSSPSQYIGKIDSDDYESLTYDIYAKEADKDNVITLRLLLNYTDTYNQVYTSEEEVSLKLYSVEEAQKYGLVAKPSYTGLIVVILLIVAGVIYFIYRRRKKKKMLEKQQ